MPTLSSRLYDGLPMNSTEAFRGLARAEDDGFPIHKIFGKDILVIFENRKEGKMPIQKLRKYLEQNKIKYVVISHSTAYTAMEAAQAAHIPGKEIAKTVIVNMDGGANGRMAMVVLPASSKISFELLREISGAEDVDLATEDEFKDMFPDCEIGAMPPFGNLYGLPVYVAKALAADDEIAFNAGNHRELIRMKYRDFERLVRPKVFDLTVSLSAY